MEKLEYIICLLFFMKANVSGKALVEWKQAEKANTRLWQCTMLCFPLTKVSLVHLVDFRVGITIFLILSLFKFELS